MEVNVDLGTYYSWVHGFGYYTPTSTKNVCTGGAKAVFTGGTADRLYQGSVQIDHGTGWWL